jgi:hypothetical protein
VKNNPLNEIVHDAERQYAKRLLALGKKYIYQPRMENHGVVFYRPDFFIPRDNVYIEVVGTRQAFSLNKRKYALFIRLFPDKTLLIKNPDGTDYKMSDRTKLAFKILQNNNSAERNTKMPFKEILAGITEGGFISISQRYVNFGRDVVAKLKLSEKTKIRIFVDEEKKIVGFRISEDQGFKLSNKSCHLATPTNFQRGIFKGLERRLCEPIYNIPEMDVAVQL